MLGGEIDIKERYFKVAIQDSLIENLTSMCEALGSIPSTSKKKKVTTKKLKVPLGEEMGNELLVRCSAIGEEVNVRCHWHSEEALSRIPERRSLFLQPICSIFFSFLSPTAKELGEALIMVPVSQLWQ